MTTPKHTPTPWKVDEASYSDVDGYIKIRARDHAYIASAHVTDMRGEATVNAAFIVLAVNSHEALLEAARAAIECIGYCIDRHDPYSLQGAAYERLEAAIAAIEGRTE